MYGAWVTLDLLVAANTHLSLFLEDFRLAQVAPLPAHACQLGGYSCTAAPGVQSVTDAAKKPSNKRRRVVEVSSTDTTVAMEGGG